MIRLIALLWVLPSFVFSQPFLRWKKNATGPLALCEGDCDRDEDCAPGLKCYKDASNKEVPGCQGLGEGWRDYCGTQPPPPIETKNGTTISKMEHIGTSKTYVKGSDVYQARINVPEGTQAGDLLILVLHRSDDYLPLGIRDIDGWKRAAECFKTKNGRDCSTYFDCDTCASESDLEGTKNVFCVKFDKNGQLGKRTDKGGRDLSQAIFYKEAGEAELSGSKTIQLNLSPWSQRTNPAWMFLSTIRGANTKNPIRDWNGTGNDDSRNSVFPSVYGKQGDLMLLSQGLDSGAPGINEKDFIAPFGFHHFVAMFDCNNPESRTSKKADCDESGYLFGRVLGKTGHTGPRTTRGNGGPIKSDSLVSITIIPKGGFKDNRGRGASEWLGTNGESCPTNRPTLGNNN